MDTAWLLIKMVVGFAAIWACSSMLGVAMYYWQRAEQARSLQKHYKEKTCSKQ